jgi:phosphoglycerate dehydrogenase-like enzyme
MPAPATVAMISGPGDLFGEVQTHLAGQGVDVRNFPDGAAFRGTLDGDPTGLADIDVVLSMSGIELSEDQLDRLPRLRGLVSMVTGVEGVDRAAATGRSIVIANGHTPENYESMAEATILLILAGLYDLPGSIAALGQGWPTRPRLGHMLRGRRVGLVGFGAMARAIAARLEGWGVDIVAYMPRPQAVPVGVEAVDLDTLVATSDVICLLAALTRDSRHLVDTRRIAMMKPGALLVNTARGALVDEEALYEAARDGRIRVALDAFEVEPLPMASPLRTLTGAILTPHSVGHTHETRQSVPRACIENIEAILAGRAPPFTVNVEVLERWQARWR